MAKKVFTEEEARERKNARQREYSKKTGYAAQEKYKKETDLAERRALCRACSLYCFFDGG